MYAENAVPLYVPVLNVCWIWIQAVENIHKHSCTAHTEYDIYLWTAHTGKIGATKTRFNGRIESIFKTTKIVTSNTHTHSLQFEVACHLMNLYDVWLMMLLRCSIFGILFCYCCCCCCLAIFAERWFTIRWQVEFTP